MKVVENDTSGMVPSPSPSPSSTQKTKTNDEQKTTVTTTTIFTNTTSNITDNDDTQTAIFIKKFIVDEIIDRVITMTQDVKIPNCESKSHHIVNNEAQQERDIRLKTSDDVNAEDPIIDESLSSSDPDAGVRCSLPLEKIDDNFLQELSSSSSSSSETNSVVSECVSQTAVLINPENSANNVFPPISSKSCKKRLLCLFCDRIFVSSNLRQKHVERCHSANQLRRSSSRTPGHTKLSPSCMYCGQVESVGTDLKKLLNHLTVEHSDKYYACVDCEERFNTKESLKIHNSNVHNTCLNIIDTEKIISELPIQMDIPKETTVVQQIASTTQQNIIPSNVATTDISNKKSKKRVRKPDTEAEKEVPPPPPPPPALPIIEDFEETIVANVISAAELLKQKELMEKENAAKLEELEKQAKREKQTKKLKSLPKAPRSATTNDSPRTTRRNIKTSTPVKSKTKTNKTATVSPSVEEEIKTLQIKEPSKCEVVSKIETVTVKITSCEFDENFFNCVAFNIQDNLLNHLDGKLHTNLELSSSDLNIINNLNTDTSSYSLNSSDESNLALTALTPVTTLLTSQIGIDAYRQIEYGSKAPKQITRKHYVKYNFRSRKQKQGDAEVQKDISKLDMWTQIAMKLRQQKVRNGNSCNILSNSNVVDGKTRQAELKVEELNRILDTRGPFQDLHEEALNSTKQNLDESNESNDNADNTNEIKSVLEDILINVFNKLPNTDSSSGNSTNVYESNPAVNLDKFISDRLKTTEQKLIFTQPSKQPKIELCSISGEFRNTSGTSSSNEIEVSCNRITRSRFRNEAEKVQETASDENETLSYFSLSRAPSTSRKTCEIRSTTESLYKLGLDMKQMDQFLSELDHEVIVSSTVELSGEWARPRIYICGVCGLKIPNLKLLEDHKNFIHPHVWCVHYEFVGNQSEFYPHLNIPGLGRILENEKKEPNRNWEKSGARVCSKCNKQCNTLGELHRHMLECGGDWSWMLAKKKCKYRPFGTRSRRRRIMELKRKLRVRLEGSSSVDGVVRSERRRNRSKLEGPRPPRPSDADTIQRMLANLPPKRATRKIMCLKEVGLRKSRVVQNSNTNQNRQPGTGARCAKFPTSQLLKSPTHKKDSVKSTIKAANQKMKQALQRNLRSRNQLALKNNDVTASPSEEQEKKQPNTRNAKNKSPSNSPKLENKATKNNDAKDENVLAIVKKPKVQKVLASKIIDSNTAMGPKAKVFSRKKSRFGETVVTRLRNKLLLAQKLMTNVENAERTRLTRSRGIQKSKDDSDESPNQCTKPNNLPTVRKLRTRGITNIKSTAVSVAEEDNKEDSSSNDKPKESRHLRSIKFLTKTLRSHSKIKEVCESVNNSANTSPVRRSNRMRILSRIQRKLPSLNRRSQRNIKDESSENSKNKESTEEKSKEELNTQKLVKKVENSPKKSEGSPKKVEESNKKLEQTCNKIDETVNKNSEGLNSSLHLPEKSDETDKKGMKKIENIPKNTSTPVLDKPPVLEKIEPLEIKKGTNDNVPSEINQIIAEKKPVGKPKSNIDDCIESVVANITGEVTYKEYGSRNVDKVDTNRQVLVNANTKVLSQNIPAVVTKPSISKLADVRTDIFDNPPDITGDPDRREATPEKSVLGKRKRVISTQTDSKPADDDLPPPILSPQWPPQAVPKPVRDTISETIEEVILKYTVHDSEDTPSVNQLPKSNKKPKLHNTTNNTADKKYDAIPKNLSAQNFPMPILEAVGPPNELKKDSIVTIPILLPVVSHVIISAGTQINSNLLEKIMDTSINNLQLNNIVGADQNPLLNPNVNAYTDNNNKSTLNTEQSSDAESEKTNGKLNNHNLPPGKEYHNYVIETPIQKLIQNRLYPSMVPSNIPFNNLNPSDATSGGLYENELNNFAKNIPDITQNVTSQPPTTNYNNPSLHENLPENPLFSLDKKSISQDPSLTLLNKLHMEEQHLHSSQESLSDNVSNKSFNDSDKIIENVRKSSIMEKMFKFSSNNSKSTTLSDNNHSLSTHENVPNSLKISTENEKHKNKSFKKPLKKLNDCINMLKQKLLSNNVSDTSSESSSKSSKTESTKHLNKTPEKRAEILKIPTPKFIKQPTFSDHTVKKITEVPFQKNPSNPIELPQKLTITSAIDDEIDENTQTSPIDLSLHHHSTQKLYIEQPENEIEHMVETKTIQNTPLSNINKSPIQPRSKIIDPSIKHSASYIQENTADVATLPTKTIYQNQISSYIEPLALSLPKVQQHAALATISTAGSLPSFDNIDKPLSLTAKPQKQYSKAYSVENLISKDNDNVPLNLENKNPQNYSIEFLRKSVNQQKDTRSTVVTYDSENTRNSIENNQYKIIENIILSEKQKSNEKTDNNSENLNSNISQNTCQIAGESIIAKEKQDVDIAAKENEVLSVEKPTINAQSSESSILNSSVTEKEDVSKVSSVNVENSKNKQIDENVSNTLQNIDKPIDENNVSNIDANVLPKEISNTETNIGVDEIDGIVSSITSTERTNIAEKEQPSDSVILLETEPNQSIVESETVPKGNLDINQPSEKIETIENQNSATNINLPVSENDVCQQQEIIKDVNSLETENLRHKEESKPDKAKLDDQSETAESENLPRLQETDQIHSLEENIEKLRDSQTITQTTVTSNEISTPTDNSTNVTVQEIVNLEKPITDAEDLKEPDIEELDIKGKNTRSNRGRRGRRGRRRGWGRRIGSVRNTAKQISPEEMLVEPNNGTVTVDNQTDETPNSKDDLNRAFIAEEISDAEKSKSTEKSLNCTTIAEEKICDEKINSTTENDVAQKEKSESQEIISETTIIKNKEENLESDSSAEDVPLIKLLPVNVEKPKINTSKVRKFLGKVKRKFGRKSKANKNKQTTHNNDELDRENQKIVETPKDDSSKDNIEKISEVKEISQNKDIDIVPKELHPDNKTDTTVPSEIIQESPKENIHMDELITKMELNNKNNIKQTANVTDSVQEEKIVQKTKKTTRRKRRRKFTFIKRPSKPPKVNKVVVMTDNENNDPNIPSIIIPQSKESDSQNVESIEKSVEKEISEVEEQILKNDQSSSINESNLEDGNNKKILNETDSKEIDSKLPQVVNEKQTSDSEDELPLASIISKKTENVQLHENSLAESNNSETLMPSPSKETENVSAQKEISDSQKNLAKNKRARKGSRGKVKKNNTLPEIGNLIPEKDSIISSDKAQDTKNIDSKKSEATSTTIKDVPVKNNLSSETSAVSETTNINLNTLSENRTSVEIKSVRRKNSLKKISDAKEQITNTTVDDVPLDDSETSSVSENTNIKSNTLSENKTPVETKSVKRKNSLKKINDTKEQALNGNETTSTTVNDSETSSISENTNINSNILTKNKIPVEIKPTKRKNSLKKISDAKEQITNTTVDDVPLDDSETSSVSENTNIKSNTLSENKTPVETKLVKRKNSLKKISDIKEQALKENETTSTTVNDSETSSVSENTNINSNILTKNKIPVEIKPTKRKNSLKKISDTKEQALKGNETTSTTVNDSETSAVSENSNINSNTPTENKTPVEIKPVKRKNSLKKVSGTKEDILKGNETTNTTVDDVSLDDSETCSVSESTNIKSKTLTKENKTPVEIKPVKRKNSLKKSNGTKEQMLKGNETTSTTVNDSETSSVSENANINLNTLTENKTPVDIKPVKRKNSLKKVSNTKEQILNENETTSKTVNDVPLENNLNNSEPSSVSENITINLNNQTENKIPIEIKPTKRKNSLKKISDTEEQILDILPRRITRRNSQIVLKSADNGTVDKIVNNDKESPMKEKSVEKEITTETVPLEIKSDVPPLDELKQNKKENNLNVNIKKTNKRNKKNTSLITNAPTTDNILDANIPKIIKDTMHIFKKRRKSTSNITSELVPLQIPEVFEKTENIVIPPVITTNQEKRLDTPLLKINNLATTSKKLELFGKLTNTTEITDKEQEIQNNQKSDLNNEKSQNIMRPPVLLADKLSENFEPKIIIERSKKPKKSVHNELTPLQNLQVFEKTENIVVPPVVVPPIEKSSEKPRLEVHERVMTKLTLSTKKQNLVRNDLTPLQKPEVFEKTENIVIPPVIPSHEKSIENCEPQQISEVMQKSKKLKKSISLINSNDLPPLQKPEVFEKTENIVIPPIVSTSEKLKPDKPEKDLLKKLPESTKKLLKIPKENVSENIASENTKDFKTSPFSLETSTTNTPAQENLEIVSKNMLKVKKSRKSLTNINPIPVTPQKSDVENNNSNKKTEENLQKIKITFKKVSKLNSTIGLQLTDFENVQIVNTPKDATVAEEKPKDTFEFKEPETFNKFNQRRRRMIAMSPNHGEETDEERAMPLAQRLALLKAKLPENQNLSKNTFQFKEPEIPERKFNNFIRRKSFPMAFNVADETTDEEADVPLAERFGIKKGLSMERMPVEIHPRPFVRTITPGEETDGESEVPLAQRITYWNPSAKDVQFKEPEIPKSKLPFVSKLKPPHLVTTPGEETDGESEIPLSKLLEKQQNIVKASSSNNSFTFKQPILSQKKLITPIPKVPLNPEETDEEGDVPLAQRFAIHPPLPPPSMIRTVTPGEETDGESEVPLAQRFAAIRSLNKFNFSNTIRTITPGEETDGESEVPLAKRLENMKNKLDECQNKLNLSNPKESNETIPTVDNTRVVENLNSDKDTDKNLEQDTENVKKRKKTPLKTTTPTTPTEISNEIDIQNNLIDNLEDKLRKRRKSAVRAANILSEFNSELNSFTERSSDNEITNSSDESTKKSKKNNESDLNISKNLDVTENVEKLKTKKRNSTTTTVDVLLNQTENKNVNVTTKENKERQILSAENNLLSSGIDSDAKSTDEDIANDKIKKRKKLTAKIENIKMDEPIKDSISDDNNMDSENSIDGVRKRRKSAIRAENLIKTVENILDSPPSAKESDENSNEIDNSASETEQNSEKSKRRKKSSTVTIESLSGNTSSTETGDNENKLSTKRRKPAPVKTVEDSSKKMDDIEETLELDDKLRKKRKSAIKAESLIKLVETVIQEQTKDTIDSSQDKELDNKNIQEENDQAKKRRKSSVLDLETPTENLFTLETYPKKLDVQITEILPEEPSKRKIVTTDEKESEPILEPPKSKSNDLDIFEFDEPDSPVEKFGLNKIRQQSKKSNKTLPANPLDLQTSDIEPIVDTELCLPPSSVVSDENIEKPEENLVNTNIPNIVDKVSLSPQKTSKSKLVRRCVSKIKKKRRKTKLKFTTRRTRKVLSKVIIDEPADIEPEPASTENTTVVSSQEENQPLENISVLENIIPIGDNICPNIVPELSIPNDNPEENDTSSVLEKVPETVDEESRNSTLIDTFDNHSEVSSVSETQNTPSTSDAVVVENHSPLLLRIKTSNLKNKGKRGRPPVKKISISVDNTENYCEICNKHFCRADNLIKHKMTFTHIAKLSELEAKLSEQKRLNESKPEEENDPDKIQNEKVSEVEAKNTIENYNNDKISDDDDNDDEYDVFEESSNFENDVGGRDLDELAMKFIARKNRLMDDDSVENSEDEASVDSFNLGNGVNYPDLVTSHQPKRYRSLGERKSFDSNLSPEQQLDDTQENSPVRESMPQINEESSHSEEVSFENVDTNVPQEVDASNFDYLKKTEVAKDVNTFEFIAQNQFEDSYTRKKLNRDEELFLECCSLLKNNSKTRNTKSQLDEKVNEVQTTQILDDIGDVIRNEESIAANAPLFSAVYNWVNQDLKNKQISTFGSTVDNIYPDNYPENLEKQLQQVTEEHEQIENLSKSEELSETSSLFSSSDTSSLDDTSSLISGSNDDSISKDISSNTLSDFAPSKQDDSTIDSKKIPTKGALKIFEGIKVSIPTQELNLEQVLSNTQNKISTNENSLENNVELSSDKKSSSNDSSLKLYKNGVEVSQSVLKSKGKLLTSEKKSDSEKSFSFEQTLAEVVKSTNKKQTINKKCGNKLGLRESKKKFPKTEKKIQPTAKAIAKIKDVYDFEDSQDEFADDQLNFKTFRDQKLFNSPEKIDSKPSVIADSVNNTNSDSESDHHDYIDSFSIDDSSHSSEDIPSLPPKITEKPAKKPQIQTKGAKNENKKTMIMGRIFKHVVKPKTPEVGTLPPTATDKPEKKDVNTLFDSLLQSKVTEEPVIEKSQSPILQENKPPEESTIKTKPTNTKTTKKPGKRSRNDSSSDDEFCLSSKKPNKKVNRRRKPKLPNKDNTGINLEQEIRECIGVAGRKSQRKCTSGKQNVLVEFWSSDELSDVEKKNKIENSKKKVSAERKEDDMTTETESKFDEKKEPEEMIPKSQINEQEDNLINSHEILKDNNILKSDQLKNTMVKKRKVIKTKGIARRKGRPQKNKVSRKCSKIRNKTKARGRQRKKFPLNSVDPNNPKETNSLAVTRRKRNASEKLYYWSSSSDDEFEDFIEVKPVREDPDDDRPMHHGWIVGDSPKKLVTMLAQAKGKKVDGVCVKEQGKRSRVTL